MKLKSGKELTFRNWADLIAKNFENYYWIDKDLKIIDIDIKHTEIYKDVVLC